MSSFSFDFFWHTFFLAVRYPSKQRHPSLEWEYHYEKRRRKGSLGPQIRAGTAFADRARSILYFGLYFGLRKVFPGIVPTQTRGIRSSGWSRKTCPLAGRQELASHGGRPFRCGDQKAR